MATATISSATSSATSRTARTARAAVGVSRPSREASGQHGLGSGVVVTPDGYILTNNHVVEDADKIHVDLTDGRTFEAKVIGTDKPSDLALVKVNATNLQTAPLAATPTRRRLATSCSRSGTRSASARTVTSGIVSAKGRSTGSGDGERNYQDFLQTDAAINHGNSGGALVNTRGEVIGINAEMLSPVDANIGIGFAIPSNMARHVMDDLRKDGHVRRAQLGVSVQPVDVGRLRGKPRTQARRRRHHRLRLSLTSAAEHAGLKRGDVIESFNGQPVNDINSLRSPRCCEAQPGASATVVIVRDGVE